ncbi:MAG: membrane protein insertase YidC, partial [Calditrichaceae bacterium]
AMVMIAIIIVTIPYYQKLIVGDQPVEEKKEIYQSEEQDSVISKPVVEDEKKAKKETPIVEKMKEASVSSYTNLTVDQDIAEKKIEINTDKIRVILSNRGGGSLEKFVLKKYSKYDTTLVNMIDREIRNDLYLSFQSLNGSYVDVKDLIFFSSSEIKKKNLREGESFKITYSVKINNSELTKTYIFYDDVYHFDVIINFTNPDELLLNRQYEYGWKNGLPSTESYESDDYSYNQIYAYMAEDLESYDVTEAGEKERVTLTGTADWLAIRTKYFVTSVSNINADVSNGIYFYGIGIQKEDFVQRLYNTGFFIQYKNETGGDSLRVYMGPLDDHELSKYDNNLEIMIMNNGWYERMFRWISLLVLPILTFLYSFIPNYGVVIIIFSILVKFALHPLTKKSYQSMKEMQKIQPIMAELKEKYKSDPQRMNKETMKLYKEHGVNPLGGCLPTLLQMPLLIALFIVFRSTIQLRGAMFIPGWIEDLSRTDTLFHLPFSLPMYGNEFNLLPILMAVTMIFQSKMTMTDPKQKAMVYIMPVFMLLIFNRFPAGLNLYYTMFNLLTIIQQKFISKGTGLEKASVKVPVKEKKASKSKRR